MRTPPTMNSFSTIIRKIGINPYVHLPGEVMQALFGQAGRDRGPIPVRGRINGKPFIQTLVRYKGAWRLYINGEMRRSANVDVGDEVDIRIEFDPVPRVEPIPSKFALALSKNKEAARAFEALTVSRQKEILRYLNSMKAEASLERNVLKILQRLQAKRPKGGDHRLEARDRR
jgi:hypothetical protein